MSTTAIKNGHVMTSLEILRGALKPLRDKSEAAWLVAVEKAGEIDATISNRDVAATWAERRYIRCKADMATALAAWDAALLCHSRDYTRRDLEVARVVALRWNDDTMVLAALRLVGETS